jgi:hypothetical protein
MRRTPLHHPFARYPWQNLPQGLFNSKRIEVGRLSVRKPVAFSIII